MVTSRPVPWRRVSREHPCPICRHGDWCTVAPDGKAVCCMRAQSARPLRNGGFLHWLVDRPQRPLPPPRPKRQEPAEDFAAMHAAWAAGTRMEAVCDLAEALGVWYRALYRLGAAWAPQHAAWAFPMRDGDGAIIGIRLRAKDGRKWAVRGSRAGLIYDPALDGAAPLLICEGPTDTAAALTLGFAAVGRPSCRGQEDLLKASLRRWRDDVVIVADHDTPKTAGVRPGLAGALDLARDLGRPVRVIMPGACKDLREWVRNHASRADVCQAVSDARWLNVR